MCSKVVNLKGKSITTTVKLKDCYSLGLKDSLRSTIATTAIAFLDE